MKRRPFEHLSTVDLVAAYETAIREHGQVADAGDLKKAMRLCDTVFSIRKEIGRRGDEGHALVLRMMESNSPWIRVEAAGYALRFVPQEAERVLTGLSIFELKNLYEEASIVYGRSLDVADAKTANKHIEVVIAVAKKLRARGHEGQAAILRMLTSKERWVRLHAAVDALRFAPEQAVPVLEDLDRVPSGACSMNAYIGLSEWRKGNIKFDD